MTGRPSKGVWLYANLIEKHIKAAHSIEQVDTGSGHPHFQIA